MDLRTLALVFRHGLFDDVNGSDMSQACEDKIRSLEEMTELASKLKAEGKKVVHCHGIFDLLHAGHIRHLNAAKKYGEVLIVTVPADKFVKRGPGQPVFNQALRAETLANLAVTDYVCVLNCPTPIESILSIKPDFYVKGRDPSDKVAEDLSVKVFEEGDTVESVGGKLVFTDDLSFSSAKLIQTHLETFPKDTVNQLRDLSKRYSAQWLTDTLKALKNMRILVIGDAIIDQYHFCSPMGKSAKESIVAHRYLSDEDYAGGSLATANHAAQLSRKVELLSVLGAKDSYEDFIRGRLDPYMNATFVHRPGCVTTVKRRYLSTEGNRKLFEVCYIDDKDLSTEEQKPLIEFLERRIADYDLVLVSDFGHGMMTADVRDVVCKRAKKIGLNVQSNSANYGFNLVTKYTRADFVCIDERELRLATHERLGDVPALIERIYDQLGCQQMIATRGPLGATAYNKRDGFYHTPALARQGLDTVGAGDAFFAYVAPCFASGVPQDMLGFIGNAVGALKLQILGNREPVRLADLVKFCSRLLSL